MTKIELPAKMGDHLAVADRVEAHLQILCGFDLQSCSVSLQGTQARRELRSSERFELLADALMEMLTARLPPQSP